MKAIVTGGAGFIGSHLVDALCGRGVDVVVIDSLDPGVHSGAPDYLNPKAAYCFSDLRSLRPDPRFDDAEVLVHFAALGGVSRAAREPENILTANAGGTARLLQAARGWKKLRLAVQASSFSIYGSGYAYECRRCKARRNADRRTEDLEAGRFEVLCRKCGGETDILPITEAANPDPLEAYGASKYMQELCYRGFDSAAVHLLRFSSAYGRRLRLTDSEATIIAKLAGWIREGVTPSLFEDGRQIRDFVYVGDIVAAILALIDGRPAPRVVNVCSGVPVTLLDTCRILSRAIGVPCKPKVVGGFRPGDMRHCLGDASTLRKLLGRDPVRLEEAAGEAFGGEAAAARRPSKKTRVPAAR